MEGITTKLTLQPETTSRFHKSRPMPHSLQPKVEETLKQMVREGNLEKGLGHTNFTCNETHNETRWECMNMR